MLLFAFLLFLSSLYFFFSIYPQLFARKVNFVVPADAVTSSINLYLLEKSFDNFKIIKYIPFFEKIQKF